MKIDHVAQCRFFSAEDACRIALQAYYAATRHLEPPQHEPWFDEDGRPWAGHTDFADAFANEVGARLALLSLERRGEFYCASDSWDLYKLASEIEPRKMAPIISAREIEFAQIDTDFLGSAMNELPPEDNHANNGDASEVVNAG